MPNARNCKVSLSHSSCQRDMYWSRKVKPLPLPIGARRLCHACYLTEEGKSFSKEFYWEQDWAIGFESLLREQASPFMLETLSPVQLMGVPIEVLREWRSSGHPLYQRLLETQLLYKEQKERFMLLYRPEQRYQVMCTQFPDLMARLCDHHIAAYLGITPISLSRIKARLRQDA